jgi:hypothetical protein
MAQRGQSIWQSRYLVIRTMFRSIAVSASSADGRPPAYRSAANETFLNKNGIVKPHPSQESEKPGDA